MAKASDFGVGLMHEAAIAAAKTGWEPDDLSGLSKDKDLMRLVFGVLRGTHEVKLVEHVLQTITDFDLAAFIDEGWKIKESDSRAATISAINFAEIGLETGFKKGETEITGEKKLKRLKKGGKIRLGAETFLALWQEEGHKTLEWLYRTKGVEYLDFFGTILEKEPGLCAVLYLLRSDGRWHYNDHWLKNDWRDDHFSASLAPVVQQS